MFSLGIRRSVQSTATFKRSFTTAYRLRNEAIEAVPKTNKVESSCKAGTVLNLKVFKKGDEPVALEDSEYPEWLWNMIEPNKNLDEIKNENFLRWRKIKLLKANNNKIKANNFLSKM
ncbi:hypothetical protein LELG_01786 [Lodderomyces elongisporus NRRL YB-4239]|uniref:Large ribosomal subunit protein mL54 n=1 Tax=Lodderomyces elongisporus (strain ATCC 11503 / CBS 2605 / JCM 1781 / NBRC 1676 / NRRL YB-4239) TaxID=379508 RepID=A5DWP9_LODEL|nr:hypothetical protein LELG_01786 [Lodderomyces elongisporus NRRL YB-4239]